MAERKQPGICNPTTNLLFSSPTEFSFSVPFIPVSQAVGPGAGVLTGDEAADVGEEDSFLGQSYTGSNQPQTFSYFSQAPVSNDPFASIGHLPLGTTAATTGTTSFSKPPLPLGSGVQTAPSLPVPHSQPGCGIPPNAEVSNNVHQGFPPPNISALPPAGPMQPGYNPYRHTPLSSKANPYITPPQLQQVQASDYQMHLTQLPPSLPPTRVFQAPPVQLPQPSSTGPTQLPPVSRPAGPLVQAVPTFPLNFYEAVQPHWFYCKQVESKVIWMPFSALDSVKLEETFNSVQPDPENVVVSTDGGRYDVYLYDRMRHAVYWEEEPSEVRRCTWFYKGDTDSRFVPYAEDFSEKLEAEYKKAVSANQWHKRLEFPSGETIVMHNPKVIVQFQPSAVPDEWGTTPDGQTRPRVVKRGIDDDHDEIPDDEVPQVDHLVFMVHGIGPGCDLRFRSIVECVDDFRAVSLKLVKTHFKKAVDESKVKRVEFLPVHWHDSLHGDATGVDRRIKKITLPSTSRLRQFTNETLLDILFYSSPTYCQTIVNKVTMEMNRLYELFMSRNKDFNGGVSMSGHSLGSLILFDILSNQNDFSSLNASTTSVANGTVKAPEIIEPKQLDAQNALNLNHNGSGTEQTEEEEEGTEEKEALTLERALEMLGLSEYMNTFEIEKIDMESLMMCTVDDLKEMGIPLGPRKKIANFLKERQNQQEKKRIAAEKKAAMESSRKSQEEASQKAREEDANVYSSVSDGQLEQAKRRPTAGGRVSSMHVDYEYFEIGTGQVSVAYHTLDFNPEIFFALGSPISMFLTVRGLEKIDVNYRLPTCKGFFNVYHPLDPVAYRIEPLIVPDLELKPVLIPHHKGRKRLHLELKESLSRMGSDLKQGFISSLKSAWQTLNEFARAHTSSQQLQAELEKVAHQIKEEEEKQVVEVQKLVEGPESSKEEEISAKIGMLNGGRRIDFVLQEKPIESFNEYLFALQSHLCYWESEDTALLILREIYSTMGINPEQPQH
ncbi:SEC23-interacting protein [Protopterus annectens]|uniref:SEC23-interacting protein n=1 Tax=Protopterus annectens TaxID=7888 RepID=UPI001CF9DEF9|nr:SEC23-interacting protein [Protopterus annectens]